MTFEEAMKERLANHGMWPASSIEATMELAKVDPGLDSMIDRWQDFIADYPAYLGEAVWLHVKRVALQWIDANKPQAFYRAMFVEDAASDSAK